MVVPGESKDEAVRGGSLSLGRSQSVVVVVMLLVAGLAVVVETLLRGRWASHGVV